MARATSSGEALIGSGKRHLHQVEAHVVGPRRGELPAVDDVAGYGSRRACGSAPSAWRSGSLLDRRVERRIERRRAGSSRDRRRACAVAPWENCWASGAERRAALELLEHPVGAALGLVGLLDLVDRDEDLGDARLGLADVRTRMRVSASSISASDTSTCGRTLRRTILAQAICASICCDGDLVGDADALQILLELAALHAGGALDLGDALVDLRLGGLHAETLGVLDLQALVDHLAQELRRQPLLQIGCVLHAGAADGEGDALLQLEVGDGIVVDTGHHAQRLAPRRQPATSAMTMTRREREETARTLNRQVDGGGGIIFRDSSAATDARGIERDYGKMRARLTLPSRWFSRTRQGAGTRGGTDPQNDHRAPLDQRLQRLGPDLLRGGLSPRQSRPLADRERAGDRLDLRGVPGAGPAAAEAEAGLDVRRRSTTSSAAGWPAGAAPCGRPPARRISRCRSPCAGTAAPRST